MVGIVKFNNNTCKATLTDNLKWIVEGLSISNNNLVIRLLNELLIQDVGPYVGRPNQQYVVRAAKLLKGIPHFPKYKDDPNLIY